MYLHFRFTNKELLSELFDKADELLPHLNELPHVLFIDHPLVTLRDYVRELFETHPAVPKFTIVTVEVWPAPGKTMQGLQCIWC